VCLSAPEVWLHLTILGKLNFGQPASQSNFPATNEREFSGRGRHFPAGVCPAHKHMHKSAMCWALKI